MKHTSRVTSAAAVLALVGALATPAQAVVPIGTQSQTIGNAELRGTIKSLALPTFVMAVTGVSGEHLTTTLRLFKGHDLTVATDTATIVRRDGRTAPLASVHVNDLVTVRVRCTFTTNNNVTTTSCLALRIYAATPPAPKPVQVIIAGAVTTRSTSAFTMSVTRIDADSRARAVADALRSASPIPIGVDSKTVVRLGDASLTFAAVGVGNTLRVHATCQVQQPYNCIATRIDIVTPRAEKVTMVGKVTAISTTSITLTVASVVHRDDDAIDAQALHDQVLSVSISKGTPIRRGTRSTTLSSIAIGTQVTVRARCQLLAPFTCTGERVTAKA